MNISQFNSRFPDNEACLDFLVKARNVGCCKKIYKIKGRTAYACQCGDHYFPTKGTIFHRSKIPLVKWFFAIYLHSQSKHGVSTQELTRHLGVTYKSAYRLNALIRDLMKQSGRLFGTVEIDETYVGGAKKGKRGRGAAGKTPLFGLVERSGKARVFVTPNVRRKTLERIIERIVDKSAMIYTDEFKVYDKLKYRHKTINHSSKLYVEGDVHTNTIEGLWSIVKRSIGGTYVSVSKKKLQSYADQFVFHYNSRLEEKHPFDLLLEKAVAF